jgi:hypothetical protein
MTLQQHFKPVVVKRKENNRDKKDRKNKPYK